MEIRNNSVGGSGPDPIDLTRANRDSIREHNQGQPKKQAPTTGEVGNDLSNPKRLGRAREAAAEAASVHKRVHDARGRASVHKRIHAARERFASVQKRIENSQTKSGVDAPATKDEFSISNGAQDLADTVIASRPEHVDSAARTEQVKTLKAQHESGQLDVDSMVAEAAYRMLGGE